MSERRIKAVIFDMDGVLIDAREWHYECLNRALRIFGMAISLSEHLAVFDGLPTKRKLQILSERKGFPSALHPIVAELKQKYTLESIVSKCRPNFVHQHALSKLSARGLKLAVASNSIKRTVDLMMECAGLDRYLEFSLSNNDVSEPKPNPEIYLTAMQRLSLSPEQCLIVEDNDYGVRAAVASGAAVLRVASVEETNYENITDAIVRSEAGIA